MKTLKKVIKVSFVGPSGSGKSTAAEYYSEMFAKKHPGWKIIKLNVAAPLHKIQKYSYKTFGLKNTGQDGKLLQFIASHFSDSLGPTFVSSLKEVIKKSENNLLVINSDCRNNAYDYLKKEGFIFIKIKTDPRIRAERLGQRMDITSANTQSVVEQIDSIEYQIEIENNGSLEDLRVKIKKLLL